MTVSTVSRTRFAALALAAFLAPISPATASTITVAALGDGGWKSDDTRSAAGADLVGVTSTANGKPGQVPSAADDTAIAGQIQFVAGPSGSTYGGAVSIDGTSSNSGKSNIAVTNSLGFAPTSDLLSPLFTATYDWYGQPNPSTRTLAFKLGIQSTDWGTGAGDSQNGFTAIRSGESIWDLVLVHIGPTSDNAWTIETVDHDSGTWNLFRQAGNGFFAVNPGPIGALTLDQWAADLDYGSKLFGAGALISSVQFGLGSGQRDSIAYLDSLQTSLLNGGDLIDFGPAAAPVPEPTSMLLLGTGLVGAAVRRYRRA